MLAFSRNCFSFEILYFEIPQIDWDCYKKPNLYKCPWNVNITMNRELKALFGDSYLFSLVLHSLKTFSDIWYPHYYCLIIFFRKEDSVYSNNSPVKMDKSLEDVLGNLNMNTTVTPQMMNMGLSQECTLSLIINHCHETIWNIFFGQFHKCLKTVSWNQRFYFL